MSKQNFWKTPEQKTTIPKKPNLKSRIYFSLIGIVIISIICGLATFGIFWFKKADAGKEAVQVQAVMNDYMQAMAAGDSAKGYIYFSDRVKAVRTAADLAALLSKVEQRALYDGFVSAEIITIQTSTVLETAPENPAGEVADVSGTIQYEDNFSGEFSAVLQKEGGEWRIHAIEISVPEEKIDALSSGR